jgi:4-hydroxy-3-methylbut-2-enyl diphosphate reductase
LKRSENAATELIVAAPLRMEARALRRGAPDLRVVRTGIGPARARRAALRLRAAPASRVAIAGLCGALDADFAPCDVVVASELQGVDVPLAGVVELAGALREQGLRVHVAPIVSVPHVVRGAGRRALLERGAGAVDMESGWLAAGAAGRPLAVVRVVLDGPNHELLRPALAGNLLRALRSLRTVARALQRWEPELSDEDLRRTRSGAWPERG